MPIDARCAVRWYSRASSTADMVKLKQIPPVVMRRLLLILAFCRQDCCTHFRRCKVDIRIDRKSSWASCDYRVGDITCAASGAGDLEPVPRDINGLAEGDRDIGIGCLIDGAVRWSCGRNAWGSIDIDCHQGSVDWG